MSAQAFTLAMSLLRNSADAEEAVGDAFAQIWSNAEAFSRQRGSVQAWVTTIVRSRAIDRLRARRRTERIVLLRSELADGPHQIATHTTASPDTDAENAEQGRQVEAAITALTPAQQESLRLAFFEGLSHSEIARRLREPLGTVKTRMRSALIQLRRMLGPLRARGDL